MKIKKLNIIAVLLALSQLFSIPTITSLAEEKPVNAVAEKVEQPQEDLVDEMPNIENEMEIEETISAEQEAQHIYELKPILTENKYLTEEVISVGFDTTDVKSYSYESEGLTVVEKAPNSMQFEIIPTEETGVIDVYADYGTEELVKSSLYTYQNDGQVYVSAESKDRAWYNCMEEKYNNGLITMDEWEKSYSEYSRKYFWAKPNEVAVGELGLIQNSVSAASSVRSATGDTTVYGKIYWSLEDGTTMPLKNTRVELRDDEPFFSTVLQGGYTNEYGEYSFTFENDDTSTLENGGFDPFIRVYSESRTLQVAPDWYVLFNYGDTEVIDDIQTGSITRIPDYCIAYDETEDANKAVYVEQAMVLGERFALEMGMNTSNYLRVVYPGEGFFPEHNGFCWGDLDENCFALIGSERFNDFDLCLHEYGHFVENAMGTYGATLWDMILNNPQHELRDDQFEEKDDKEYAMNLVWSEAWAYAFAQIAQEYYATEYSNVPDVADQKDKKSNVNFETPNIISNMGEANEISVFAMLWDLFDDESYAVEGHDDMALGYQTWWNWTTRAGTYTLTDFMNVVERYYYSYRGQVGEIMAHYKISPLLTIKNNATISATEAPILEWTHNGSVNNPNDHFQVVLYNVKGEAIYYSEMIYPSTVSYTGKTQYTIPFASWYALITSYYGVCNIKIGVLAYHTEEIEEDETLITGPYSSNVFQKSITPPEVVKTFNKDTKYQEQVIRLDSGMAYVYKVRFTFQQTFLIQTFGAKDTVIHIFDENDVLLAQSDDDGFGSNGFIRFNPTAGGLYKIKVRFYGSASGQTKLSITCANGAKKTESASLDRYYDILTITTNVSKYTWGTYAYQNRARVICFVQQTSGYYNFTIESDFDTYMYVIDPRSNQEKVRGVDYDDDSGEGMNPSITKYLEAGVQYYVIYSAYNPGALTETKSLKVIMQRV